MAASNNNFTLNGPGVQTSTPATSGLLKSPALSMQNFTYQNSTPANYTPSTPVKSISTPDGSTTTFHAPTTPGVMTSNVDNVNHTYSQGGQNYALNPATGRYELSTSSGTTPGMINSASPSSSGYLSGSNAVAPGNADGSTNLTGLTGIPPKAPDPYTPNPNLQGQMITGLANQSQQPGAAYTSAQEEANRINQQIEQAKAQMAQQTHDINTSGTWTSRALGEQGQANIQNASTLAALGSQYQGATNQLTAANAQQGLQQSALGSAITANAPQFPSYSQQVYNPATGFAQGGNSMESAVQNVVQKLQNGTMTYDQATSALAGYGQGGLNALQQALPQGFNQAQSATLAQQQGSIKPAYEYAKTALTNLQNAVGQLGIAQGTNIPIINYIGNGVSSIFGVGSQATQAYRGALAESRSAIQKVLASVSGGTPTDYVGQSMALLPDDATPSQIKAAMSTLDTLGGAKVNIYGNPGTSGTTNSSGSSSSLYSW